MIKFRCPHCDQKLGVPEQYAGRRVRCTRCEQAVAVPSPQPAAAPEQPAVAPPPQTPAPADADLQLRPEAPMPQEMLLDPGLQVDETEAARMEAIARARPPRRKSAAKGAKTRPSPKDEATYDDDAGFNIGRAAIAVGCSSIATLVVAAIWATMMGYMAQGCLSRIILLAAEVAIPMAGALVLGGTMRRAGIATGLLAVLIGMCGIIAGKYFTAKWYWVPRTRYELKDKTTDRLMGAFGEFLLSDNEQILNMVAASQMAQARKIDEASADQIGMAYAALLQYGVPLPEFDGDVAAAFEKIEKEVAGWTDKNKEVATRTTWFEAFRTYLQKYVDTQEGSAMLLKTMWKSAFSVLDFVLIPLGAVLAFRTCWKDEVGPMGF